MGERPVMGEGRTSAVVSSCFLLHAFCSGHIYPARTVGNSSQRVV